MEKCQMCQFYDRQNAKPNDGKLTQWGQCRREAPMLHPINAKSYMIEGVWPHAVSYTHLTLPTNREV